jgi:hypothetical protein
VHQATSGSQRHIHVADVITSTDHLSHYQHRSLKQRPSYRYPVETVRLKDSAFESLLYAVHAGLSICPARHDDAGGTGGIILGPWLEHT